MLFAGGAAAAVLALSGCGAGMISQTADQVAAVPGFSATVPVPDGGNIALRDAMVGYPGIKGYPAGADAPLQLRIFNDTDEPVTLESISSNDAASVKLGTVADLKASPTPAAASPTASPTGAASASPKASGSPSPAASPSPSAAAAPAKPVIQPGGYLELTPQAGQLALLTGLKKPLANGEGVHLKLTFSNGVVIETLPGTVVPVAPPLSLAPRVPVAPSPRPGTEGEGH
ncbi:hypothetical protein Cba03nite_27570 [Catellatospora bangladeshensis]|uniref:Copper chaperone PCu(A)C n=2 Tax=Catellatospora bangladeshensis TaxID=310355 RepID=A0A8J3JMH3_9ACTN|nr:hypothetical protein Cba03nite_27570 [Catellatospora bangladeshensis]